ncbi:hypothetical protein C5F49_04670 [Nitrosopumilus oxyclinae]|uniref:Uncharacterized protein n=1 Tax=Nitrosopumilus oxyclinae TaxID=1959104 RepID=A0A7D5RAQ5_9ARCH|nr:hypothetical protein [Nitrosopumilus oxyclinae]QLH04681.1 hypothetical protein C5F49_04670 [Nitrosopumilus oxyclinae]
MVIVGDLIELTDDGQDLENIEILNNFDNISWTIQDGTKIPVEIFSLYSTNSGAVTINDVNFELFDRIKKSNFSHVFVHIDHYEEMFILFFEFATETESDSFEFVHFGFVPTGDFFSTLSSNPVLKIKTKNFKFSEGAMKKILEKLTEFNSKYSKNSQF